MAITELDVHAAADALLREGERPTIERVRLKLGRGSPNTITGFLNSWFAGLGQRLAGGGHGGLPDPVARLSQELWRAALAQAHEQVAAGQTEEASRLAAEAHRLATLEQALAQAGERLRSREADLELGLQALRQQLAAAQDAARDAGDALRSERRKAAMAEEAVTQARAEAEALRAQLVDVQGRQADALAQAQARHAAQERRWLNELDAERQATKRLTAEIERARQAAERDRQSAEREREAAERERLSLDQERQAAERARGEMQAAIAALQGELRQALRGETSLRAELAATSARLEAEQAAARAAAAVADTREAELRQSLAELSARLAGKDRQLDALASSLAPRRAGRRGETSA
ncbi:DNA-binding protein [Bordetella genomosp. 8]|nr:DNA-binding protein [Bordetella genomosp. 8]